MARILVIDDDNEVREMICTLLARQGHEVTQAADGQAGIHSYRNHPVDLIITDLFMPVKEGLETIVDLRREFPNLRIIAISGATGKAWAIICGRPSCAEPRASFTSRSRTPNCWKPSKNCFPPIEGTTANGQDSHH